MRGPKTHVLPGFHQPVFQEQDAFSDAEPCAQFFCIKGFSQLVVGTRFQAEHGLLFGSL